jgi:hypothetical protein
MALLLKVDFDSAKSRTRFFGDCSYFASKIVLTKRVKWFEHPDKPKKKPKENSAWFIWSREARQEHPALMYAPQQVAPAARKHLFRGAVS